MCDTEDDFKLLKEVIWVFSHTITTISICLYGFLSEIRTPTEILNVRKGLKLQKELCSAQAVLRIRKEEILYRHLFGLEAMYYTVWSNPLCVLLHALTWVKNFTEVYVALLSFSVLCFLRCGMLFLTLDNRSERKIYRWRRIRALGLCLTTQHIQKMSFEW